MNDAEKQEGNKGRQQCKRKVDIKKSDDDYVKWMSQFKMTKIMVERKQ